ncbi:MAG: prolyl oligopeptidase family serine peptidase [Candidatus Latescibacteria bacterium]|jgi:dienelactone hydrolase|nr:prolyl oligopeptidase family serine peptidase [Candidatus Latescibacterota bacterium]
MYKNGYGHMVLDHTVAQVREIRQDRAKRLASIRTRKQALNYQEHVQEAIDKAYRPWPRKTPLNAQVVDVVERRHYNIEKVIFESRPGCLVTGHLYVPHKLNGLAPGVVGSCGHSANGKLADAYQSFCQRLARNGFVTFMFDPFNQGERDQYYNLKDREIVNSCTHAHNMMGKQLELVGEWFGAWRAWDGIRALDYLLTRPEVDPNNIGLTGNSGGGTMTSWIWAVEKRFTMAAPSCFITTFLANLENELPADSEQYPPGVIGEGLEMADFLIARAPAPAMLLGQTYCFFDRRGLKEAYSEIQRFYSLINAPKKNTDLFIGPEGHGYSWHNQEAMVRFFCNHTHQKRVTKIKTPENLGPEILNVTPTGEVVPEGATPIYDLIAQKANALAGKRKKLSKPQLIRRIKSRLTLPLGRNVPHYRCLRAVTEGKIRLARYAIETEDNIRAIMRKRLATPAYSHTLDVESVVHLYLPHVSSEQDLIEDRWAVTLKNQHPLYALDVRGLGESLTSDERELFHPYGNDYMCNGYGLLLGESFLGRRVHDVLSTLDLLVAEGAKKIHLYGRGQGAVHALFAGILHDKVNSVTLKNGPISYHAWTQTPLVNWPASNLPQGVLKDFDLPDIIRALGAKVSLVQPWGPTLKPLSGRALTKALQEAELSKARIKNH